MKPINSTQVCFNETPSAKEFFAGFPPNHEFALLAPIFLCLMTLTLFVVNLRGTIERENKSSKGNVAALLTIYPIVACSSLVSLLVPRTFFFCDTIAHISFVIISYQFYRLCINYIEGESKFIAISKDETFSFRAPPCCCCFACFKKSVITKPKFKILRFLVLQMAIVHIIIFLALNLISIENPDTLDNVMVFFVPFIAGSIILGVWAFQITIRTIVPYYVNLNLLKKFLCFQLVLIFCKLQPILLNLILKHIIVTCEGPFTVEVQIRSITQLAIMMEMFLLSLWAHNLYKS